MGVKASYRAFKYCDTFVHACYNHSMRKLFVANWKMHKTTAEIEEYLAVCRTSKQLFSSQEVIIAPSFPYIGLVAQHAQEIGYHVAGQWMGEEEEGPRTGAVSARQLADVGATYVLIGHSEQRAYYSEELERIQKKLQLAKKYGLIPILCVGETTAQYTTGTYKTDIIAELEQILTNMSIDDVKNLIIGYEPIWAIGTGKNAAFSHISEMHQLIKQHVKSETRLIYGGSVKKEMIQWAMSEKTIDGFLVGTSGLDPHQFCELLSTADKLKEI